MRIFAVCCPLVMFSVFASVAAEWQVIRPIDRTANAEFGIGVAASGKTALIGAWRDDSVNLATGSAYVFERDAAGQWTEARNVVASDPGAGAEFGRAVAVRGGVGLVGAPGDDERGSDAGSAYIVERDLGGPGVWGQRAKLLGEDITGSTSFGRSVALWEGIALAGAPGTSGGAQNSGSAYLFERDAGGANAWGQVKKLLASDAAPGARFGAAVSIDTDTVAVGAPGDSDAADGAGAVYIFGRNQGGANQWGQLLKLNPADAGAGDDFGAAVMLHGDNLFVGATQETGGGGGAVYVFKRNLGGANAWGLVKKVLPSEVTAGARFGAALSVDGLFLLAGAPGESRNGQEAGAAYLFHRDLGGVENYGQAARLSGSDATVDSVQGGSVALVGRTALVGAPGDAATEQRAGAVYVFDPAAGAPTLTLTLSPSEVVVDWAPVRAGYLLDRVDALDGSLWEQSSDQQPPVGFARDSSGFFRLRSIARAEIDYVPVGDPGNTHDNTGVGQVVNPFQIGAVEVSNEEYARFLNAVAGAADAGGVYNPAMSSDPRGGILRSAVEGGFQYSAKTDMGNKPVVFVSYYDALRFANWLHNDQPAGAQDSSTTEDGAYTLTGLSSASSRLANAKVWLPSEDEWYKAAYYDPTLGQDGGYWLYPTRSNDTPALGIANAAGDIANPGPNVANFDSAVEWNGQVGNVTTVGSAGAASRSYYGAADLGGNVAEWTEGLSGNARVRRGGSWADFEASLEATNRGAEQPDTENNMVGFRVARP